MKSFMRIAIVLSLMLIFSAGSALAVVSLPDAIFYLQSETTSDTVLENGTLSFTSGWLSRMWYTDWPEGCYHNNCESGDSMLHANVTVTPVTREGIDYFPYRDDLYPMMFFSDAIFTISNKDDGFVYFQADLTNIVFLNYAKYWGWDLNPGLDSCNSNTHNLSNIALYNDDDHPSRFIDEYRDALGPDNTSGLKMGLMRLSGDFFGDGRFTITGLLMGPPPIVDVDDLPRSTGYWKNHDTERLCLSYDAVQENIDVLNVFNSKSDIYRALKVYGKKSMEDKVKQQLAALLLNIAAGIDPDALLTSGQLSLLQEIVPAYGLDATVGDAVWEIETAFISGDNLETAKDLAESINKG